jgi:hypothetical protein
MVLMESKKLKVVRRVSLPGAMGRKVGSPERITPVSLFWVQGAAAV